MAFLFKKTQQLQSLESEIVQNNDLYEGRKKILEHIDLYYDGLELDTDEKKAARWKRTPFYIYYPSVISSFTSSIFKKPPQYTIPEGDFDIENIDLLGNSLDEYASQIPHQVLKQGFCASIIDFSNELKRPFFNFIKPERFVSFRVSNKSGYPKISQFIYTDFEDIQDEANEFETDTVVVHYVWDLFNGKVRVRKYKRVKSPVANDLTEYYKNITSLSDNQYEDVLDSTSYIKMNNKSLDTLPIIIHGQESNNFTVNKSVLQDVSDLNINVFQRVCDQIEVLHMTAMPTPYITGADASDSNAPKTIGSNKIWFLENPDSQVGLLEFTGKAYDSHEKYIKELTQVMAVKGAQILRKDGVSRETATSVILRTGQETAIITDIVQNISHQIEEMLKIYFKWLNEPTEDITYKLNSDFLNVDMEPNAQIALVKSWLDGAISHKTLFEKMKQGEIIASDKTYENEMKDIEKDTPPYFDKQKDAEYATTSGNEQEKNNISGSNMETGNEVNNPVGT